VIADSHLPSSGRSRLPKEEARRRYVALGELAVLEQIRRDAGHLDTQAIVVGPFARLDANAVAAAEGKTRGVISNLFGSQAAFQAATMALTLGAEDEVEAFDYPDPTGYASAAAWVDAFFEGEAARGPLHGGEPAATYGHLWALWLTAVPYGLWSEHVRAVSMAEHARWTARLAEALGGAIAHYDLELDDATLDDLALAACALIEGAWLNQCLTTEHPNDPGEPIAALLRRGGRLLWRGATRERGASV